MVQPFIDIIPLGTRVQKFLTLKISDGMLKFIIDALKCSDIEDRELVNATLDCLKEIYTAMTKVEIS